MGTGISTIRKLKLYPTPLLAIKEVAPDVFVIRIKREEDFIPGQVVGISHDNVLEPRLYSIASGKDEENIDILFNIKYDGLLSPILAKKNAGDILYISKPFGSFILNHSHAYWIASGTGIAPFRSYYRSGYRPIELIHGGRTMQSFYFHEEFENQSDFPFIRCCSSDVSGEVYAGRLTHYLRQHDQLKPEAFYFLCGSAEMVVEVRDILIGKGIPYHQVVAEIYF